MPLIPRAFQELELACPANGVGSRAAAEFLEGIGNVHVDRASAQEQLLSNLTTGVPIRDQAQNLEFSARESGRVGAGDRLWTPRDTRHP